jgi:hypothetical protein
LIDLFQIKGINRRNPGIVINIERSEIPVHPLPFRYYGHKSKIQGRRNEISGILFLNFLPNVVTLATAFPLNQ